MNILSFETSCGLLSVAVSKHGVMYHKKADALNQQSKLLFSMIKEVLNRSSLIIEELDAILLSNGPGSFTGVRIGIAAALGIKAVSSVPIYAFSTMQSLATRKSGKKNISLIAGNDSFYSQLFYEFKPQSDISISSKNELLDETYINFGHVTDQSIMPDAVDLISFYNTLSQEELSNYLKLEPLYIKSAYF
ncbi:MAG: tRNA (adenosine(37)-N6)-threonylcarbamoyltransferase complex dimerization subunit type 1 TsaB [Alphaproteobacteria bacterium]|jgi:tRNA threonylcarbamoyl adenosine modification protein YeaZ|nr:tRNA (adenosine(37)-N6)-threonylcarbamoyltransferase complex dimerization subunit type 1 TsaB [Candidatus Jidaibacter sp.]